MAHTQYTAVQSVPDNSRPGFRRHNPYSFEGSIETTPVTPTPFTPLGGTGSGSFTPLATPNVSFSGAVPFLESSITDGPILDADLSLHRGQLAAMARTAVGSSLIQSSLKGPHAEAAYAILIDELPPAFGDLLLDCHGCYAMRALMERMPRADIVPLATQVAEDEALQYSICTHSLHTRRMAQYMLEMVGADFLGSLLIHRCDEVATTQQGCIVIQRAMDVAHPALQRNILAAVYAHALSFAKDAFANYVVQHAVDVDTPENASRYIGNAFEGHIVELSCNKFASNVIEKCLSSFTPAHQHAMLMEMYNSSQDTLLRMMHDSFGNYIIQSSIALASTADVQFIAKQLSTVVHQSPYGHKLVSRLERRLRGLGVPASKPPARQNQPNSNHRNNSPHNKQARRNRNCPKRPIPVAPAVQHTIEESW